MADILIRGLSDTTVAQIDTEAAAQGLSRNEYLRRRFEAERSADGGARLTVADLRRAAEAARDLDDPNVMEAAWR
ncbi:hypothetical protein [[Mycobacterium] holstebronense]|uniref:Antitoxin n=1 Tax=[Mycobacterium] holstebronense TaxID=3064288 RepID=A0ABN9NQR0_9MYCO|nr:hypothetical protein [Mycolicibacter sp. MU0102]CAJ1510487.1 hypothetical protein MU0102_004200 [Mycolicibacter sp. MU0102]